ncbi:hypothetical protein ACS2CL_28545 [Bacillus cereus group sp. BceL296]|uniref:Uncharacterized protein n=1 Tax=Bacillus mobilis TaxID=2026190 RepID=A0ABV4S1T5_9BACI|nr:MULTISPECIES: hypothetical protein [Bacillus]MCO4219738.1 hypothetical protein [Bacillus sp. 10017]HDR7339236.1 hypothetical protein [Bacillus anthracis]ADH10087.1 hypothetical protein BMB171_P0195 [Bacillus thuringiensis BMB171]EEL73537.1 hypothetical protein bcere0027_51650 [Bacillus cereus AH676]KLA01166.1 hypothetical protein B4153_3500 [Bacillus cereus]
MDNDIKSLFFFVSSQNKRILFILKYPIIFYVDVNTAASDKLQIATNMPFATENK